MRRQGVAWTAGAVSLGLLFATLDAADVDVLTRVPASLAGLRPWAGAVHTFELLCWASSASILLYAIRAATSAPLGPRKRGPLALRSTDI